MEVGKIRKMKIISLVNSKGGVGKTTFTVNLSHFLDIHYRHFNKPTIVGHDRGGKILLVDADKRGSLRDWYEIREEKFSDLIIADTKSSLLSLKNIEGYNYAFIDTPGYLDDVTIQAIKISDVVLIPVTPSPYDIWVTEDIVSIIEERSSICDKPLAAYVLSKCIANTKMTREICYYLENLTKQQADNTTLQLLSSRIHNRTIFPEMSASGGTVFDSSNTLAVYEVNSLGGELMELLKYVS